MAELPRGGPALNWRPHLWYDRFERVVIHVVTLLIVIIVASATVHLAVAVALLLLTNQMNPANEQVFQTVFGMIFIVLIGLEFKHSLPVGSAGAENVVRVRTVVLIAVLAMVRKFIILDLHETETGELFALAAAILALGVVYWLVRDPAPASHHALPLPPGEGRGEG